MLLAEDSVLHIIFTKGSKGVAWRALIRGHTAVDEFTASEVQKSLMLERFQEEVSWVGGLGWWCGLVIQRGGEGRQGQWPRRSGGRVEWREGRRSGARAKPGVRVRRAFGRGSRAGGHGMVGGRTH